MQSPCGDNGTKVCVPSWLVPNNINICGDNGTGPTVSSWLHSDRTIKNVHVPADPVKKQALISQQHQKLVRNWSERRASRRLIGLSTYNEPPFPHNLARPETDYCSVGSAELRRSRICARREPYLGYSHGPRQRRNSPSFPGTAARRLKRVFSRVSLSTFVHASGISPVAADGDSDGE